MTLTIHKEEDEQRQLKITAEVAESRVQTEIDKFIRKLSREVHIPGFRRGKVPKNILVRRFGEETLRAEAVEEMLEGLLAEVLEEVNSEDLAFYQPVMDDMELNPLVLKLTLPLEPKIKLGDYRAIRKELDPIEVTDEAIEEAIDHIRAHHQILEDVDRAAQAGDMATITGTGYTIEEEDEEEKEEEFWHVHGTEVVLDSEKAFPGLPIVDNIIGMSVGDEKEFSFTFPEDYEEEELASKEARMSITLDNVQSRFLPAFDDELAKSEGGFETAEELKENLIEQLDEQAHEQAKADLLDHMVDQMLEDEQTEMVFPPAAVEGEIDRVVESLKGEAARSGLEWSDFVAAQGGEKLMREQWRERAETNVRRGLVLRQFVQEEKIKVTDADIDAQLEDRLAKFGDNEELRNQLRDIFLQGQSFESIQQEIIERKIHERMKAIVSGNAPDLASLEEEDEAPTDEEE